MKDRASRRASRVAAAGRRRQVTTLGRRRAAVERAEAETRLAHAYSQGRKKNAPWDPEEGQWDYWPEGD